VSLSGDQRTGRDEPYFNALTAAEGTRKVVIVIGSFASSQKRLMTPATKAGIRR
jgi:hypothetical protein